MSDFSSKPTLKLSISPGITGFKLEFSTLLEYEFLNESANVGPTCTFAQPYYGKFSSNPALEMLFASEDKNSDHLSR